MFTEKTTSACLVTQEIAVTIYYYSILRIRLLYWSATYRFVPSVVIPLGELKLADVPVPFAEPEDPVPARVVTTLQRLSSTPWRDPPICVVVSEEDELLFLAQEKMVRLKRKRERIMSICFTWFPIGWFRRTQYISELGLFYKNEGRLLGVPLTLWRISGGYLEFLWLCEEFSGRKRNLRVCVDDGLVRSSKDYSL